MNQHTDLKGAGGLLGISWHDTQWIPILNPTNILDYFSERSNPFYDKTCNNEIIKMQRLNPSHLNNMEGIEYILLHVQEPILYVIRKQHRFGNGQITPLTDYYCIAGVVYQAPDLGSIVNSRLMNSINHLQSAFDDCLKFTRYHPSRGYTWEFKEKEGDEKKTLKIEKLKEEPSSLFQRQRVDMLLLELSKKFLPRHAQYDQKIANITAIEDQGTNVNVNNKSDSKESLSVTIKQESVSSPGNQTKIKAPPEKKPRLM